MREKKILSIVAASIRAYRRQRGLTIEKLAEKAGIDAGFLSHVETEGRAPSLAMLARIGAALEVEPADLLVDPTSATEDALARRVQTLFKSLGRSERVDFLAVLGKPHLGKELKSLRRLLRA